MMENDKAVQVNTSEMNIGDSIYTVRGEQVMIDYDLASFYGVETKVLNQAVKRNITRFPEIFWFKLSVKFSRLKKPDFHAGYPIN